MATKSWSIEHAHHVPVPARRESHRPQPRAPALARRQSGPHCKRPEGMNAPAKFLFENDFAVVDRRHQNAREKLDEIMGSSAFAGKLVLLGEPEIAPGDCRIEWADGGIKRERAVAERLIDDAVARYLAGRRGETYMPETSWRPET